VVSAKARGRGGMWAGRSDQAVQRRAGQLERRRVGTADGGSERCASGASSRSGDACRAGSRGAGWATAMGPRSWGAKTIY
jgi:predicted alpha/beta hydrolase